MLITTIYLIRRIKVLGMWEAMGSKHEIERLACWDFILADNELATLMGNGDTAKGKKMLEMMKAIRALDASGDGFIDAEEFQRLYLPQVITAALEAVDSGLDPEYMLAL